MIPKVSPNKSWEGFWGGLVFTSLIAIIFYKLEVGVNYIQVVVFSFIIPILATLGDLVQSRIKRDKGVKDSGNILPGHGGFYDRMDSIIFIAPWSFYVLNQI
jgi:phosphatidate cytidylyltransferase